MGEDSVSAYVFAVDASGVNTPRIHSTNSHGTRHHVGRRPTLAAFGLLSFSLLGFSNRRIVFSLIQPHFPMTAGLKDPKQTIGSGVVLLVLPFPSVESHWSIREKSVSS